MRRDYLCPHHNNLDCGLHWYPRLTVTNQIQQEGYRQTMLDLVQQISSLPGGWRLLQAIEPVETATIQEIDPPRAFRFPQAGETNW